MSTAPWNESFWQRQAFDKLLISARSELNEARRAEMYHELQVMISDDGGWICPLFNDRLFASAAKIEGLVPTAVFSGARAAEQLYFI
jgi:peptide/nickel transport system substrate-binding protein